MLEQKYGQIGEISMEEASSTDEQKRIQYINDYIKKYEGDKFLTQK